MDQLTKQLWALLTHERQQKIENVLGNRTRALTLVLEDIFDPHNASACLRSAEAFEVLDVHIIENNHKFELKEGVAQGTGKWLNLVRHRAKHQENTMSCFSKLKAEGYQIYAATPHQHDIELPDITFTEKIAVVFGSEKDGLSSQALELADLRFKIPMTGFAESLNISVSCAVTLSALIQKLKTSKLDWKLTGSEITELKIDWAKKSIPNGELIYEKFMKETQF
jgi:tRNA (guanosine-2'-O-)-methyltransferase